MSHSDAAIDVSQQLAWDDPVVLGQLAEVYFWQGQLHRQRGMLADAEPPLRRALKLAREAGATRLELDVLTELGFIEITAGGREQATHFQEGLNVAEEADDAGSQATMLARLAIELVSRLELEEALSLGERALELARLARDEMAVARSLDGLKLAQLAVGDLVGFRATIAELEDILRRHDDLYFLQYALIEHGTEASASGRWDDATKLFDEALTLNRRIKNNVDEALMLAMHANASRGHGDYETALRSAHESFRISENLSHRLWLAWASVSLGLLLEELGDDQGALEVFSRVTTADASLTPRAQLLPALAHTALGQLRAGAIQSGTETLDRAEQLLARATCPPGRVFLLASDAQVAMARAHLLLGDGDRAIALLDPLMRAADSAGWHEAHASSALALGEVHRPDDPANARSLVERALDVATKNELLGLEWRAAAVLAGLSDEQANDGEAAGHRERAHQIVAVLAERVADEPTRRNFAARAAEQIAAGRLG